MTILGRMKEVSLVSVIIVWDVFEAQEVLKIISLLWAIGIDGKLDL